MRKRLQLGVAILAAASCAVLAGNAWAQKPHAAPPPQSHSAPPHPQNQGHKADRPPANPNRPPASGNGGNNRPAGSQIGPRTNFNNGNRFPNGQGANLNQRQQLGVGSPRPWVDTMRELSPQQRERVLQSSRAFQNLSPDKQNRIRQQFSQWDRMTPSQRSDLQQKEQIWQHLTPAQRDHIKNDVLPKWRQMPWDRQQMMKQKLGVLQNMPESARNERLSDPNFTRGMSDDERSMLRDLSHTHIGTPDTPVE
jgi:Protein of unknown function (DUF3106)